MAAQMMANLPFFERIPIINFLLFVKLLCGFNQTRSLERTAYPEKGLALGIPYKFVKDGMLTMQVLLIFRRMGFFE